MAGELLSLICQGKSIETNQDIWEMGPAEWRSLVSEGSIQTPTQRLIYFASSTRLTILDRLHVPSLPPADSHPTDQLGMSLYPKTKQRRPPTTSSTIPTPSQSRPALSDDQRQEIKEAFELFDTDKDGAIDYHELKVAMRALGFDMKKAEVLKLLRDNDRAGDGLMDFESFQRISD